MTESLMERNILRMPDAAKEFIQKEYLDKIEYKDWITPQQKQEPAQRFDAGKPRYDLLPGDGLEELVKVYTLGANKYAARNWEKGMSWGRVFGSLMRHSWAYWRGETYDKETGLHHMAMAAWNCITLLVYSLRNVGTDDRQGSKD